MCRQGKCTKEKIIDAAVEVFAEKGKHGARMEEIAKRACVNKSMLYYYYSTKDNIFREVLRYIFGIIFSRLSESIDSINLETDSPVEKLKQLSRVYFSILSENVNFVKTMAEALTKYPEEIQEVAREYKRSEAVPVPFKILEIIQDGISNKVFRDIDPRQVLLSIIAINLFYFLGKPMAQAMLELNNEDEERFLTERKESVIDLFLYGLVERNEE
ncbi:TetR/AcrR family transcriptional regulator [bacterium]|nr:TetR/AcrR family transcriptional regulator [bacterium]